MKFNLDIVSSALIAALVSSSVNGQFQGGNPFGNPQQGGGNQGGNPFGNPQQGGGNQGGNPFGNPQQIGGPPFNPGFGGGQPVFPPSQQYPYPPPQYRRHREADGGLLGSILGGVFGGGNSNVGVDYGRNGLVGGILDAVFGNSCNPGVVGSILGTGGRRDNPECYGARPLDYIALRPRGGNGNIINTIDGPQNTQIINISGLPTGPNNPNGILQIQGPKQAFYINNGQYFINPDPNIHYDLSYF